MHTRICTVPSGEVPVDQTAWPLTVILPPPTAGLGLRATCNASEPAAGGSEAVIGGPVVLGGRVGTYEDAGGLAIFNRCQSYIWH